MKRIISVLLAALTLLLMAACGQQSSGSEAQSVVEPKASQMKSICELATMECYYHNVAKYKEENADDSNSFFLLGEQDATVLKYSFEENSVLFVFSDNSLTAVAVYSTENWNV